MKKTPEDATPPAIEQVYDLDAPPGKVWRAISISEFREKWLPDTDLLQAEAAYVLPEREIQYKMREDTPPNLESTVTITITPNADGGTRLRILHQVSDSQTGWEVKAVANCNEVMLLSAA